MPSVPPNTYVCPEGHLTEADDSDLEPEYDYRQFCRRYVWRSTVRTRCRLPVGPCPEAAYATFLVGGEDAVKAIVIDLAQKEINHG